MAAVQESSSGRDKIKLIAAIVIFVAALGLGWYSMGGKTAAQDASVRNFKCAKCDKPFSHTLQMGEIEPIKCPECGEQGGYTAELCYWVKLGDDEWGAKSDPTYVIMKNKIDPETEEATYCPDCGREVVGHNPLPPPDLMEAAQKR